MRSTIGEELSAYLGHLWWQRAGGDGVMNRVGGGKSNYRLDYNTGERGRVNQKVACMLMLGEGLSLIVDRSPFTAPERDPVGRRRTGGSQRIDFPLHQKNGRFFPSYQSRASGRNRSGYFNSKTRLWGSDLTDLTSLSFTK